MKQVLLASTMAVAVQAFRGDTYANAYERCGNSQNLATPYERCFEGYCCSKDLMIGSTPETKRYCLPQKTSSASATVEFIDTSGLLGTG